MSIKPSELRGEAEIALQEIQVRLSAHPARGDWDHARTLAIVTIALKLYDIEAELEFLTDKVGSV